MPLGYRVSVLRRNVLVGGILALVPFAIAIAIAASEWKHISSLLLPLPSLLPLLTLIFPFIDTPTTAYIVDVLTRRRSRRPADPLRRFPDYLNRKALLSLLLVTAYGGILVGVLSVYATDAFPTQCALSDKWHALWSKKSPEIGRLQDALNCCGFMTTHDMSYPFLNGDGKPNAHLCEIQHKDRKACLPALKAEAKKAPANLLVAITVQIVGGLLVAAWVFLSESRAIDVRAGQGRRGIEYGAVRDEEGGRVAISSAVPGEIENGNGNLHGRITAHEEEDEERPLLGGDTTPHLNVSNHW